ncbi:MAG: PASTA domain-containing protein, partial [Gemmatimonadetes bacterium]|nr:PASTA domain-containing protein [Gemmatimonadota bacterium]
LVIFVKLDQPRGGYYGGLTAAPVTRETMQGLLAARTSTFDTRSLLASRLPAPSRKPSARVHSESGPREGTFVFDLDHGLPEAIEPEPGVRISVPQLEGLAMRDAARRSHALGLNVRVKGSGSVRYTSPVAGSEMAKGDTLVLNGVLR